MFILTFCTAGNSFLHIPWDDYGVWAAGNGNLFPCEGYFSLLVVPVKIHLGTSHYYLPVMDSSLEQLRLEDAEQLFLQAGLESSINVSGDVENSVEEALMQKEYALEAREDLNTIDYMGELFMAGSHTCLESEFYARHWLGTMNSALDALELSMEDADFHVNEVRGVLEELKQSGICDDGYTWEPKNACENLASAVSVADSGSPEGAYGKINILYNYTYALNDGLGEDAPNTTLYYRIMELVWAEDGIIGTFHGLAEAGRDAKDDAKVIYRQYKNGADFAKGYVDDKYSELEDNELKKIERPVALGDESTIGTIAERYDTIKEEKENADRAYDKAEDMFANTFMQGYLKYATINMSHAKESYEYLEQRIDSVLDDAEQAVDDVREEADEKINEARSSGLGSAGQERLNEAENALDKGDDAEALGEQYEYYIEAVQLAEAALGKRSWAQEGEIRLKIAEVEDLLERAEDDGINVAGERAELEMLENSRDIPDIIYRLDSLGSRIIGKAEMIFSGLLDEREELLEKLRLAGAGELIDEMEDAESGIVAGGRIDYENGLGRLSWLRSQYQSIGERFEEDLEAANDVVANSIVTDASLIMGKVRIDEPTDISLNVLFMNTRDVGGEDIEVTVEVPGKFQFDYFDIAEGADGVSGLTVQGYKLKIMLKSVEPYGTKSVTFEKSQILARSLREERSAAGLGDGSARIEENRVFDLDVDNAYIEAPEGSEGVMVDGLPPGRPLSKGVHTLSRSYTVEDAYDEYRSDAETSSTETETTVSYRITVTPGMDLDTVPVVVDVGGGELTDISISCIEYDYDVVGTRIDIFNLEDNSPATVQVSYTISDMGNYVTYELEKLEGACSEPEILPLLEDARILAGAGSYESALRKIEEIRKQLSEIGKSKSKLIRKYSELAREVDRELEDLDAAITRADGLGAANSTLIDRFLSRKGELSDVLSGLENISSASTVSELQDAVDDLGRIDGNWLKKQITSFRNDATKQLNGYRNDFAGFGNETAEELLETLEHAINVLAASEKAESAVAVIAGLDAVEKMLAGLEEEQRIRIEGLRMDFESLKEDVEDVLSSYTSELKSAKGTSIEQLFTVSESSVNKLLSDIEKSIGGKSSEYVEKKMSDLEKLKEKMEDVLDEAGIQADGKIRSIKSVFSEKKDGMAENERKFISDEILQMEQLTASGSYANAIKKGDAIIERINRSKGNDSNFLFLLLASVLVLAMIIIYMIREQKKKKPRIRLEKGE